MNEALPDDLYCMLGQIDGGNRHGVRTLTSKEAREESRLRGMRANWIIFFQRPTDEEIDNIWKPCLYGGTSSSATKCIPVIIHATSDEMLRDENSRLKAELDHYRSILDT